MSTLRPAATCGERLTAGTGARGATAGRGQGGRGSGRRRGRAPARPRAACNSSGGGGAHVDVPGLVQAHRLVEVRGQGLLVGRVEQGAKERRGAGAVAVPLVGPEAGQVAWWGVNSGVGVVVVVVGGWGGGGGGGGWGVQGQTRSNKGGAAGRPRRSCLAGARRRAGGWVHSSPCKGSPQAGALPPAAPPPALARARLPASACAGQPTHPPTRLEVAPLARHAPTQLQRQQLRRDAAAGRGARGASARQAGRQAGRRDRRGLCPALTCLLPRSTVHRSPRRRSLPHRTGLR